MLIGQTIFVPSGEVVDYFSPWFPRQADAMAVVYEVLRQSASGWQVDVLVETKNAEDPDSAVGAPLGTLSVSAVGTDQLLVSKCLELVRYHYRINAEGSASDIWIHARANPPIWQPN